MRLAPLLAALPDQELDKLALEHIRSDERPSRIQLCTLLESAIRSYRFVNDFVTNRQPPSFSILALLLESAEYKVDQAGFRERVLADVKSISQLVDSGDLVARKDQLRLYRKALYEARRNDLDLNSSEAALLAVLRREEQIAQVEHFLVEHHQDLREFWDRPESFDHEMTALISSGLVFSYQGSFLIPADVAPAVWQTLGIDMPTDSLRRLYGYLSNSDLADVLERAGTRVSGSKEVRLERLVTERIQPRFALQFVALSTLKDVCRETDASVSGNKDELIERVIAHFAEGRDQRVDEPAPAPVKEDRHLNELQFKTLFSALQQQELIDILRRQSDLRQSGTKEVRIRTLWESHFSEKTLLGELMNRQLEDVLHRLGLRLSGSKDVRIQRLIEHFAGSSPNAYSESAGSQELEMPQLPADDPVVLENQQRFVQRASNPQASLQPWLEELLSAPSFIRCYATEDDTPTKQLKNKLAQAAAAKDGMLVLLLANRNAFEKAREALLERWLSNAEWSKSVAAVALAFPLSNPVVTTIIERIKSPVSAALKSQVFPEAEVLSPIRPTGSTLESVASALCEVCGSEIQPAAKFCSNCGARLAGG
jgi:hypothetical protein